MELALQTQLTEFVTSQHESITVDVNSNNMATAARNRDYILGRLNLRLRLFEDIGAFVINQTPDVD